MAGKREANGSSLKGEPGEIQVPENGFCLEGKLREWRSLSLSLACI